jgi:hypothetical protein
VSNPLGGKFNLSLGGTGIIKLQKNSYTQVIKDMGGFWTCKFDILGPPEDLGEFMDNGLGRDVRCYNHFGSAGWQGLVTTLRKTSRTNERLVSLERAANKIYVRFSLKGIPGSRTAVAEDTDLQNKYGILELIDSLDDPVSLANRAESLAEMRKKDLADPHRQKEFRDRGDPQIPSGLERLTIYCSGYSWYLTRRIYNKTTNTDADADTVVSSVITDTGEFVQSSSIAANTQQINQFFDKDDLSWDIITAAGETGDTSDDRYIAGMYEDRKFIYEARAASTLPNITLWKDKDNRIFNQSHRPIAGMLLRPNTYLRNTSIQNRPGKVYDTVWDDPQVTYVSSVRYDESDQSTTIVTEEPVRRLNAEAVTITLPKRLRRYAGQ